MVTGALGGGVAAAMTVRVQSHHEITGTIGSVDGTSAAGTCGTAGEPGDFSLSRQGTPFTVEVEVPSTSFKDKAVSTPSFADVCAGDHVHALGALSSNDIVTATEVVVVPPHPRQVSGTVDSVNGIATPGACGTAGEAGDFVLTARHASYVVDVSVPSTAFEEHGVSTPSFADVCQGAKTSATGMISSGDVVAATLVAVIPPRPWVSGTVTAVNGITTPGACGTAGESGNFSLDQKGTTYTVEVEVPSTTFQEKRVSTPSFADVCVGAAVRADGAVSSDDAVTATEVVVIPPPLQHVSGTVTAVNSIATPGTCGTAGEAGNFSLDQKSTTDTVEVGQPSTTFKEKGVSTPSFADVCVGAEVRVAGAAAGSEAFTATQVVVVPPPSRQVSGTVTSVNGTSTCGRSGMAGDFVLTSGGNVYTVDVGDPSTTFQEQGVNAPSFAAVCKGDKVKVRGTITQGNVVTANDIVVVVPPK